MCCNEHMTSERCSELLHPIDSRTYRANSVHTDKFLESIDHFNAKIQEDDEFDKISKLLDIAESRIDTLNSVRKGLIESSPQKINEKEKEKKGVKKKINSKTMAKNGQKSIIGKRESVNLKYKSRSCKK